jgi:hypothetical protein
VGPVECMVDMQAGSGCLSGDCNKVGSIKCSAFDDLGSFSQVSAIGRCTITTLYMSDVL